MLEQVVGYVNDSFGQSVSGKSVEHFERTLYWLRQLHPEADEPMQISAYSHDIARAFRKQGTTETFKDKELNDPEVLREHQEEGARIMWRFLVHQEYDQLLAERVYRMIDHHEVGGDSESDLIKDADSLSYLEVNAPKHIKLISKLGEGKIRRKIDWMYERITSEQARELAEPFYRKAIDLFDSHSTSPSK